MISLATQPFIIGIYLLFSGRFLKADFIKID